MLKKAVAGLAGTLLMPAVAGLGLSVFRLLTDLQTDPEGGAWVLRFFTGCAVWLTVFLFLGRPVRMYVLAHEISHLLAAWISGVSAGRLRMHDEGGSVTVARSTIWIALAPYMIPFYTLLVLLAHLLASLWFDPGLWRPALPFVLGLTWSFHLTFTVYALCAGQSDLRPYGILGAIPLIVAMNLLLLCIGLGVINRAPVRTDARLLVQDQRSAYGWSLRQIGGLKNTIIPD